MDAASGRWMPTLLLLLLTIPTVASQDSKQVVLDDARGDVTVSGAPHPADFIDLTKATFTATDSGLGAEIQVAGTQLLQAYDDQLFRSEIRLDLQYREEVFLATLLIHSTSSVDITVTRLTQRSFTDQTSFTGTSLLFEVPWSAFQSSTGFSPVGGESVYVKAIASAYDAGQASSVDNGFTPVYGRDQFDIAAEVPIEVPGSQSGFRLSSPRPALSANGEEAVHSWTVEITELAGKARTVTLEVDPADATSIDYPATIDLAANAKSTFRVTALFPFGHQHGGSRTLTVHAVDRDDKADYALQVNYIQPPQPAGHHDTLYIHAFGDANVNNIDRVSMNTSDESAGEAPAGAAGRSCMADDRAAYSWIVPLAPKLEIGIDGRLGETVHFVGTITQSLPSLPVDLRARLAFGHDGLAPRESLDDESTLVTAWTGNVGESTPVDLQLPLPEDFDYVEPAPGRNMYFVLALCSTVAEPAAGLGQLASLPAGQVFKLEPGASLTLPFNDFRPLEQPVTNGLQMTVDERFKFYPPGSDAVWDVDLANAEDATIRILAPDEYHARIQEVHSDGFSVAMSVPAASIDGGLLDFVVVAMQGTSKGELRLGVYVDGDAPSFTLEPAAQANGAPGPGLVLVLVAVAVALAARRH